MINVKIFKNDHSLNLGDWSSKIPHFSEVGFSLIEILVALSILALIGAISIPNLRRFNEDQILQNTANDVVRNLRQAQSGANSRIGCTSSLIAKQWVVDFATNTYQLSVSCYNPSSTGSPPAPEVHYSPNPTTISGVSFSARTPTSVCTLPTSIIFSAEYKPFDQNRFSNIGFNQSDPCNASAVKMEIDLLRNSHHSFVCIDKGGAIYASASNCF